jgi:hypothetical protein
MPGARVSKERIPQVNRLNVGQQCALTYTRAAYRFWHS